MQTRTIKHETVISRKVIVFLLLACWMLTVRKLTATVIKTKNLKSNFSKKNKQSIKITVYTQHSAKLHNYTVGRKRGFQNFQNFQNFKNRSIFGDDMNKSLVSCFLTHSVVKFPDYDKEAKESTEDDLLST